MEERIRRILITLIATLCAFAPACRCHAEVPADIAKAPTMYKGYFGETFINDIYLAAGRKDILGKWHPTGNGPDLVYRLQDGRIEVHEVGAYSDWPGREKLRTTVRGREMDQLSNAWLAEWEERVLSNPIASEAERNAALSVRQARLNGTLVRIFDEVNLRDGKWRSSSVFPVEESSVRLEERTGPLSIERMEQRWAEARLRLDKLRLKEIEADTDLLKSPKLSEFPTSPAEWADYERLAEGKVGKCSVRAGLLTGDGRLIVGVGEGATAGLLVFSLDAGEAGYHYLKGEIYHPAFERVIMDAAVKGGAVGGCTAVAVFLGASPQGWIVLGLGVGAYCITDMALSEWHEHQNHQYLSRNDLAQYGIDIDSVLDINGKDAPLNIGGN